MGATLCEETMEFSQSGRAAGSYAMYGEVLQRRTEYMESWAAVARSGKRHALAAWSTFTSCTPAAGLEDTGAA